MRVFKRLLGYMRPYLFRMIAAVIMLAIAGGLMSLVVATFNPLVNEVILARPGTESVEPEAPAVESAEPDLLSRFGSWLPLERLDARRRQWSAWLQRRAVVKVPLLFLTIFLVRGLVLYFGHYLTAKVGASVIRDLRAELYESLVFQSLGFFKIHKTGIVLSRILSDVQRIQRVSTNVLADLVRVGAMAPCLLVVVLIYDWRMSAFTLVVLPLLAYPMIRIGRRLRKASQRSQESTAEASHLLTETVAGIKVVQGFAMERFEIDRFRDALGRILRVDLQAGRAAALSAPIMEQIAAVAGASLFYFAGVSIARGAMDPGDFVVVLTGLVLLFLSLRRLNQVNVEVQQALAAAQRVFEMMDWEREIKELPDARPLTPDPREIRFEGVEFAYEDEPVLNDVGLTLRVGETVALVGPSGSGKSTLANLVPRFHDPTAGRVAVDGNDLREVTLASLRAIIGLVTQETVLFDDSVRNNITCGREVPEERVIEVARAAQAHEFIGKLPEGYDTRLGEAGTRLSMGQRQRITIARALLKDPPILILDEATSALDAESEDLVQQALATLLQGRGSLVIAHRLATVRQADRILVMDAGRIVEEGTHGELLARGGLYARLHALQFREGSGHQPVSL
ncbi:MAG: ATP-binding cassette domain-containing protein [bacterium]|nr:ATP-binding cassette domain-containing protein [bacterium]